MPWMTAEVFDDLFREKITPLGYYSILTPICAGLVDGTYVNWRSAKESTSSASLLHHLAGFGLPTDEDDLESVMYTMYPSRKYHKMKARLGLEGVKRADYVDPEFLKTLFLGTRSVPDALKKMRFVALDPALVASMTWLSRTDSVRLTPYLMYSAMFRDKDSSFKRTIRAKKVKIMETAKEVPKESLFPMWKQFHLIDHVIDRPLVAVPLKRKKRLRYQWVSPYYSVGDHIREMKSVLLEVWFARPQRHLSRNQVRFLWNQLCKDIPFFRENIMDTLEASPYEDLAQLYGYIESASGSMRSVKLLARGVVNQYGQSLDVLMRHNISPYAHYTTRESLLTDSDHLLREALTVEYAPVISPRLMDQVSRLEDRMKGWYEILHHTDQVNKESIYDLFLTDLRTSYAMLSSPDKSSSSTGSQRLDSLLLKVRLMIGEMPLVDFMKKIDSATIWVRPDDYSHGQYDNSGTLIRKRFGSLAKMTPGGVITVEGEEYHAKEMFKTRQINQINHGHVEVLNLRSVGLTDHMGNRVIKLSNQDRSVFWYMSPPDVKSNQYHSSRGFDDPDLMECWLSRTRPTERALKELFTKYSENSVQGSQVRSIAKACKKVSRMVPMYRIAERMGLNEDVQQTEADYDKMIIEYGDDFAEGSDDDTFEDFLDYFKETQAEDILEGAMGLEAFSVEHQLTAWDLNPCLQHITKLVNSLRDLPSVVLIGSTAGQFLSWFDGL
jgi:hypothetical protein